MKFSKCISKMIKWGRPIYLEDCNLSINLQKSKLSIDNRCYWGIMSLRLESWHSAVLQNG
jgi:hypothetical protein